MKSLFLFTLLFFASVTPYAQIKPTKNAITWSEADRKYLLDNLIRSKQEIIDETKNLTTEQWNFKENENRWSINQIVEHLAKWELLFMHDISTALQKGENATNQASKPDNYFIDDPKGQKNQSAVDYTKPFTYAVPLGNNEGKSNVLWLNTMRDESIEYLKKETKNLRLYYDCDNINVHQVYMIVFGHTDRHLRQLRKVKQHTNYPK